MRSVLSTNCGIYYNILVHGYLNFTFLASLGVIKRNEIIILLLKYYFRKATPRRCRTVDLYYYVAKTTCNIITIILL